LLTLINPDTFEFKEHINGTDLIGEGFIEVTYGIYSEKRHRFIISTRGEGNSLVGIYFHNNYIYTLRAALWEEGKPFVFLDTFRDRVIRGNCR
jgi:hypothetical protein